MINYKDIHYRTKLLETLIRFKIIDRAQIKIGLTKVLTIGKKK